MPRIVVFQPALPAYRVDFFKRLSERYGDDFHLYYSHGSIGGAIEPSSSSYEWASCLGSIHSIKGKVEWQPGVLDIDIRKGDLVVICGAPRCLTNLLLLLKAKVKGAKTIWWGHFRSATTTQLRFYLRSLLFRFNDALLFYTDREVLSYRAIENKEGPVVAALNNGIDVEPIKKLRKNYDPVERGKNLLFIGRLTHKSNFDLILRAMVFPEMSGFVLHVVGGGGDIDRYKDFSRVSGLEERIIWHGELVSETDIAIVANQCAVFVYPGAVGLSLIHAMAYGLPAIVHNNSIKHMPEIYAFQQGKNGYAFSEDSPGSLVKAIDFLLTDRSVLESMSSFSRAAADNEFNTGEMAARFFDLIGELDHELAFY